MSVKRKYSPFLELGESMSVRNGSVDVVNLEGRERLVVKGEVETFYEKDLLFDKAKEIDKDFHDLEADIKVRNKDYYAKHTVEKGDTLSKIAKKYYGKPMDYMQIFNANSDKLDDPDKIFPGQELIVPVPDSREDLKRQQIG